MELFSIRIYALIFFVLISGSCISAQVKDSDKDTSLKELTTDELILRGYDGDMDSRFELGLRYEKGQGVYKSAKSAHKWYKIAAEQGHIEAQYRLGLYYLNFGRFLLKEGESDKSKEIYRYAVDWLEDASESGHLKAQIALGDMYYYGWGVVIDEAEAIKRFRQSAEKNYPLGLERLARSYQTGKGVEKDLQEAARLYLKSAELGNANSMHDIGYFYYQGIGVEKDVNKSLKWFNKACKNGFEKSCPTIASVVENENVDAKEVEKLIQTVTRAREAGIAGGIFALGYMYSRGIGFEKDINKGFTLYIEAAEKGFTGAFERFIFLYLSGHHPKEYTLRIRDLLKSKASSKNEKAYCGLGVFYTQGLHSPVNPELGYVWLNKCVDAGISRYQKHLDDLIERMSTEQINRAKEFALQYE